MKANREASRLGVFLPRGFSMNIQRRGGIGRLGVLGIAALALLSLQAPRARAQEATGSITGKVSDPSGAAVAKADVAAKDVARGTEWKTQTDNEGAYNFPRLPVGRYELRIQAPGFEIAHHAALDLVLNQTATIDVALTVGGVTQTVEVTSAAPLLQSQTTEISSVMESHTIESLPLETRNYNQLALLIPGALTTSPASLNTGQATFNSARPYINGNREQANYYLLDGMDNNEFVDNNVAYSPSVDAIEEFNVITNNPSAEFGEFLGGVISVSIKSGTNQYHGSAFEFIRNDFFNANEWSNNFSSDPSVSGSPPKMRWNEFGATFGGPIKKDKLFFFVDYQGSRLDTPPTATTVTTFTNQERTGNLSDIPGIALHYPGTAVVMPSDLTKAAICGAGQTFGSSPCINGLSPTALKIIAALPMTTLTGSGNGTLNNLEDIQGTAINGDQGDVKIDWAASAKDHVFGRYSQQNVRNPTTNSQPLLYNSSGNNLFPLWNAVIDYTRTIAPNLVNEARVGASYYPAEGLEQNVGAGGVSGLIPGQPTAFLPGLFFAGAPLGGSINGPYPFGTTNNFELFHQTVIQFEDTAIWTHNVHTFKFGFQALRYRNDYVPATTNDGSAGQIGFNGSYTGNAEADFLVGLPYYLGYGKGFAGTVGQRNSAFGAFVQDDWRITSHLTLNIGLRWQMWTPIYEVHDRMTNFSPLSGQIELAGMNGNSRALYNQYNGIANFLPRIGVAWSPWDARTVIRAAFSQSSFQEGTGEFNRLPTNAPWNIDLVNQSTAGANGSFPANQIFLDQGFAALGSSGGCTVANVTSAPAACFAGVRIHFTDPTYRPAVSNQWSLGVQHQFGSSTTVQAVYVGQHTDHLADILFAGQRVLNPNGTTSQSPFLAGNAALIADHPGQLRFNSTTGYQNYDALQLTGQQRLNQGLAFQINYTLSKCLTDTQGYYARFGDAQVSQASADRNFQEYAYNLRLDYGPCDHDVRHLFNGYVTYDLPFGKNRMFGKNAGRLFNTVLGDWQFNTLFTVHGGFPISIFDFSDPSGTGSAEPRPSCTGPAHITPYKQNPNGPGYQWFDATNMVHPTPGTLGNCPNGFEQGPGYKQIDMSLAKRFVFTEHQSLEFRFEAINAFNTPIFGFLAFNEDIFGASTLGVINTSQGARNLQFGLKYHF